MVDVQAQPDTSRPNSRQRFYELSRPKAIKTIWITSQGPRVQWGTQETLWPVTKEALQAESTPRVIKLAEPKKNFQDGDRVNRAQFMFSCGRSSGIWGVAPGATEAEASPRVLQLSEPKKAPDTYQPDRRHFVFSCGRSSPIWEIKQGSGEGSRPLTEQLAQPKKLHKDYVIQRGVRTEIPKAALSASTSGRLETLASPKHRSEGQIREPIWPVSNSARSATPTNRCMELARAKPLAEGYLQARQVIWEVPKAARRATATQRMGELANPIIRATMDHVQFDPDAFLVKQTALKGRCSRRVEELAEPIRR